MSPASCHLSPQDVSFYAVEDDVRTGKNQEHTVKATATYLFFRHDIPNDHRPTSFDIVNKRLTWVGKFLKGSDGNILLSEMLRWGSTTQSFRERFGVRTGGEAVTYGLLFARYHR